MFLLENIIKDESNLLNHSVRGYGMIAHEAPAQQTLVESGEWDAGSTTLGHVLRNASKIF